MLKADSEVEAIIAGAKTQADNMVAAAKQNIADLEKQNRAILQDSEIRIRVNQETAEKILADVAPQRVKMLSEAAARAQSIVEAAEQNAARIIEDAKKAGEKTALAAQHDYQEVLKLGREKVDLARGEANSYLDTKRREAEASAQKILQEVNVQIERMHSEFEVKKRDELARMESEVEQIRNRLKQEQEGVLKGFESDFSLKHRLFDEECAIRRRQVEKELQSETEKISDCKKTLQQLGHETQIAQERLKKTLDLSQSAESHLFDTEKKMTATKQTVEDLSGKVDSLSQEERRLQAFVSEVNSKKSDHLSEIKSLQRKFEDEKSRIDKEAYDLRLKAQVELNDLRQKENLDIQRVRMEELEKIDVLRRQAVEDIVRNKAVFKIRLAEKIEARIVTTLKEHGHEVNMPDLRRKVLELVQGSIEEQSYELAQGHEADIKHLVATETNKRKVTVRRLGWVIAGSVAGLIGLFIHNGGNITNVVLGLNQNGETGAEEFGRVKREERAGQKFDPPQSDFIKSNYTDNVLYTRSYTKVYNDPQLQEKWIHELNKIFQKDWGLDDDAIVKFVALESTLITRLQTEKDSIIPGFEKIGIDKMRKVEKESLEEMKVILKDPSRMRKFQSFGEKFWYDGLKERLPASN
jgi:hypothetical protein